MVQKARASGPRPERLHRSYRPYSEDVLKRLRFIRHAKELEFSLKETEELLSSLRFQHGSPCAEVKIRSMAKLEDIREKIKTLKRMEKVLSGTGQTPDVKR